MPQHFKALANQQDYEAKITTDTVIAKAYKIFHEAISHASEIYKKKNFKLYG